MTRPLVAAMAGLSLLAAAPVAAAPCKDAKGKFVKCPPKPSVGRCKLNGKFAKCGTPGVKPA
jgi:hypothetical protein